jgi:hypothetical protein
VVEIFRLEDGIDAPIRAGLTRLGLPLDKVDVHHARKSSPTPVTISRKVLDRVRKFYAQDFKTYRYDPDQLPALLTVT